jgi:hypothetical protein
MAVTHLGALTSNKNWGCAVREDGTVIESATGIRLAKFRTRVDGWAFVDELRRRGVTAEQERLRVELGSL